MRIAATADLHGHLPEVPACDLLLVAGDVCPLDHHGAGHQRRWLEGRFAEWLERAEAGTIVGVAGNHDFVAQDDPALMRSLPWTYLCGETVAVDGLSVHASPWVPTFGRWAFMRDDADLDIEWLAVPDDVDVLVTHGPPRGHGDLTVDGRLPELSQLRLHVFGHIHESGGTVERVGSATFANVSHVDVHYGPALPPVVFEL